MLQSNPAGAVDTVVFDLGGVLIDWDPRYLYRKIFVDDPATMEWFLETVCPGSWNVEQDRGRPWDEAIAEATARHPDRAAEIAAYRARWHEMISGPIHDTVAILERLHSDGVPLYAITNWAGDTFAETRERYEFLSLFRGIIVSGDLRMLKPDPEIFHALRDQYGVDLTRSVFIDDSAKNVVGARAVGMQALHFTSPAGLATDLAALGFHAAAA
jgi:2-haloacid dehalogenase